MPNVKNLACIALGANLGDGRLTLRRAAAQLASLAGRESAGSSIWITDPVDCPEDSPLFYNAALVLEPPTGMTPESLLEELLILETGHGRKRLGAINEPRPLDLDLIAFGRETRRTSGLTLPHPRAHKRLFVLGPLAEIAPGLILPGQGKTVAELLEGLPYSGARNLGEPLLD